MGTVFTYLNLKITRFRNRFFVPYKLMRLLGKPFAFWHHSVAHSRHARTDDRHCVIRCWQNRASSWPSFRRCASSFLWPFPVCPNPRTPSTATNTGS